ncbi:MAG: hypothetical protein ABI850_02530, partial [Flavobacterium sp.]
MSIAFKTRKKAKRRLLNLCSVLTVNKKNDKNNEMNITINDDTVVSKLILSIHCFFCTLLKYKASCASALSD